jgi:hypothetical protein
MTTLADAVKKLAAGDWEAAHSMVQNDESRLGCWAHGIVHILEGDLANAGYWYQRAGRPLPHPSRVAHEIAALGTQVDSA